MINKRKREREAEEARARMKRVETLTVEEHEVVGRRQLWAAIPLATERPCIIRLHLADGRVTTYRFPWGLSEERAAEIREAIAKTGAAVFQ
jgi:hypothetical protein